DPAGEPPICSAFFPPDRPTEIARAAGPLSGLGWSRPTRTLAKDVSVERRTPTAGRRLLAGDPRRGADRATPARRLLRRRELRGDLARGGATPRRHPSRLRDP